jgi:hypothetical protein
MNAGCRSVRVKSLLYGLATIGSLPDALGVYAMSNRLGDDDAYAVDLLLDQKRMLNNSDGGSGVYRAIGDSVAKRIGAVEFLLHTIGQMPAGDPPAGLAARTIERIRTRALGTPIEGEQPTPHLGQGPISA